MKKWLWFWIVVALAACNKDEQSCISVRNQTDVAIYVQPYSTDFTDGGWIQPGWMDDFYSIDCDCLDGFKYFSFYYDSLIIHLKGHEEDPIKFFKTGRTVNYDPTLNPFTNPDVWKIRQEERSLPGKVFKSNYEERIVIEHYFTISSENIKSLKSTEPKELTPAF